MTKHPIWPILSTIAAFAAGVAVGVFNERGVKPSGGEDKVEVIPVADAAGHSVYGGGMVDDAVTDSEDCDSSPQSEEVGVPPATVEVIVDDSPEPQSEISSAHAARRARRQAAREARSKARMDFLSSMNTDLLTPTQKELHQEYVEATEVRDAARCEIAGLRLSGQQVPEETMLRLADAESVLRADREAELRALREAAARAAGLDEESVKQLAENLEAIDGSL